MRRLEDRAVIAICFCLAVWGAGLLFYHHEPMVQRTGGVCIAVGAYVMGKRLGHSLRED